MNIDIQLTSYSNGKLFTHLIQINDANMVFRRTPALVGSAVGLRAQKLISFRRESKDSGAVDLFSKSLQETRQWSIEAGDNWHNTKITNHPCLTWEWHSFQTRTIVKRDLLLFNRWDFWNNYQDYFLEHYILSTHFYFRTWMHK